MGILPTSDRFPLLIVLNPHSGLKQGHHVLETIVKPALSQANQPFRVIESTAQGHAQSYFFDNIKPILIDLVQSLSSVQGTGDHASIQHPTSAKLQIMVLGGDGTVHEIANGILRGLEGSEFISDQFRPRVEFSVIPTGTGNALSTSLGVQSAQDAVDRFLKGHSVPLQLMSVSTLDPVAKGPEGEGQWKVHVYTMVVNSFGLHCATVYDSEEFRHLGNDRFRQAAMKNIEHLKQYPATVTLKGTVQQYDRSTQSFVKASTTSMTTLSGPFTYFLITKQASLEPGFTPTPRASTSDEWMDVLAVTNVGQAEIMEMFGATATGEHIQQEKVQYFKTKILELEIPAEEQGRLCIDGEFLTLQGGPQGKVRFEVVEDPNIQIFGVYA
ncbi:hypothetical protein EMPS_08206 [Entomortierella parvispora]|uniref:DAGKc domain-containing protein n=1 Tax=Entomortierella parvispora TaxID=205924 RepID=A0A9P3LZ62_9FUNG|nr:hypothetical protein EMPS_08206 [Entomortierella parvispora]